MKSKGFPYGPRKPIDLTQFADIIRPYHTLHDCFCAYSNERLLRKGKDVLRPWQGFNRFFDVAPPSADPAELKTGQIEEFIEKRVDEGMSLGTVRRELVFVKAAILYAFRRNRISKAPYFELPDYIPKKRRPLTDDEYRLVIRQRMSGRLYRFYRVAYYTGHRSQAIQELTWDRVDFQNLTFDFNVPGRRITNKRRCADFPIPDEFVETLEGWRGMARDEFVIGAGPSTYPEAAHVVRDLAKITDPSVVPRHCMRKMFATRMFAARKDPELVGHLMADRPDTLRRAYVTHSDERLRDAVNAR